MAIDAGTVVVTVVPNTAGFTASLTGLIAKTGGILEKAGLSTGTAAVGVALGVAAVAATKAALDFEAAFTKIDAVSNASAEDIGRWKEQVLSLATETAQSPQELADALYFLASAGLDSGEVMDTLEASAKASATGLGETSVVARVTAQALNAYATSGLTASDAVDTLVAAVKAGTAEPEEFAQSIGRVLPIASRAGVSFQEVAASLASLSNIGLDVSIGTTALRGLLSALVAPGTQAAQTMAKLGISTDEMRETLSEGGLLDALQLLEKRTHGNIDELKKIVPNIRALTAELGLTGENASHVQEIFDEVVHSTGALDEAFQTTTEGPMFTFQQALSEIQVTMIELGQSLLPIAEVVAGLVGGAFGALAGVISNNTDLLRNLLLAFLAFKAITFLPALFSAISGSLTAMAAAGLAKTVTGLYGIANALVSIGASSAGFRLAFIAESLAGLSAGAIAATVVGVAGLAAWYNILSNSSNALKEETAKLTAGMMTAGFSLADLQSNLHLSDQGFQTFLANVRGGTAELSASAFATETWTAKMKGMLEGILSAQTDVSAASISINARTGEVTTTVDTAASAYDAYATSLLYAVDLTNEQKLTLAQSIDSFYRLGGTLTDGKQKWLDYAISAGKFGDVSKFLETQVTKLREEIGDTAIVTDNGVKNFANMLEAGDQLASGIGTTFTGLSTMVKTALDADGGVIGEKFEALVTNIQGKVQELANSLFEAVNLTGQAIGGLSEQALKSPEAILKAFNAAKKATQDFGKDLLTITREGGKAGKALATNLLASGEAGRVAANTIANAAPKMRDSLINAFAGGEAAATNVANKLTGVMAAALKDIRYLLLQIAKHWEPTIDLKDNATPKIQAVQHAMQVLDGTTATVIIDTRGVAHGGGGPVGLGPSPSEFGSYLPGAARGGFVAAPQLLRVGEHHKSEMILPLENKQGVGALAKAMALAGRSLDGGKTRGGNGGTAKLVLEGPVQLRVGKTSMDAYISGVARAEDDKQSRYDERLSRMRRD